MGSGNKVKLIYEKVNITDLVVIAVLGIALLMAIFYKMNELSMSIASGMIGYMAKTASLSNEREDGK